MVDTTGDATKRYYWKTLPEDTTGRHWNTLEDTERWMSGRYWKTGRQWETVEDFLGLWKTRRLPL